MKRAPRSRQRHDLYAKYHDYDSEISDLLGECGLKSKFAGGTGGWTVVDGAAGFGWVDNPLRKGGHIAATDAGAGLWGFVGPAGWTGDLSDNYGGTITYSLRLASGGEAFHETDITITAGDGSVLTYSFDQLATSDWTRFKVTLDPYSGWRNASGAIASEAETPNGPHSAAWRRCSTATSSVRAFCRRSKRYPAIGTSPARITSGHFCSNALPVYRPSFSSRWSAMAATTSSSRVAKKNGRASSTTRHQRISLPEHAPPGGRRCPISMISSAKCPTWRSLSLSFSVSLPADEAHPRRQRLHTTSTRRTTRLMIATSFSTSRSISS